MLLTKNSQANIDDGGKDLLLVGYHQVKIIDWYILHNNMNASYRFGSYICPDEGTQITKTLYTLSQTQGKCKERIIIID